MRSVVCTLTDRRMEVTGTRGKAWFSLFWDIKVVQTPSKRKKIVSSGLAWDRLRFG